MSLQGLTNERWDCCDCDQAAMNIKFWYFMLVKRAPVKGFLIRNCGRTHEILLSTLVKSFEIIISRSTAGPHVILTWEMKALKRNFVSYYVTCWSSRVLHSLESFLEIELIDKVFVYTRKDLFGELYVFMFVLFSCWWCNFWEKGRFEGRQLLSIERVEKRGFLKLRLKSWSPLKQD